jgi:hypothetical protein
MTHTEDTLTDHRARDTTDAVLTARALVSATIYGAHRAWRLASVTRYARRDGTWKPVHSRATTY